MCKSQQQLLRQIVELKSTLLNASPNLRAPIEPPLQAADPSRNLVFCVIVSRDLTKLVKDFLKRSSWVDRTRHIHPYCDNYVAIPLTSTGITACELSLTCKIRKPPIQHLPHVWFAELDKIGAFGFGIALAPLVGGGAPAAAASLALDEPEHKFDSQVVLPKGTTTLSQSISKLLATHAAFVEFSLEENLTTLSNVCTRAIPSVVNLSASTGCA